MRIEGTEPGANTVLLQGMSDLATSALWAMATDPT